MRAPTLTLRIILFSILACALPAQTLVTAGDGNLSLAQVLRFHPEGMILSLPGAQGRSLGPAVEAALDQEPAAALQISSQELEPGQKAGIELQRLKGWGPEQPHWALIGRDKQVYAEGSEAPTPGSLFETYRQSSLHTRAEALRDFLKINGDQTDALARLVLETRALAERRTERLSALKPPASDKDSASSQDGSDRMEAPAKTAPSGTAKADPPAPVLLSEAQDGQIWEEYAALYERFITDGHWLDLTPDGTGPVALAGQLSDAAEHSPRLVALALKLLPAVEDRLRSRPSDEGRWRVWTSLRSATGEVRPSAVLQGLRPLPGARRWPPAAALNAYVEEAQRTGDWHAAEPVLQAAYDQNQDFLRALEAAAREDASRRGGANPSSTPSVEMGNSFGFGGWSGEVELLLEAKLRLGKTAEADRLFQEVYSRAPKTAVAASASELARTCGAPGLAEKWGRLAR